MRSDTDIEHHRLSYPSWCGGTGTIPWELAATADVLFSTLSGAWTRKNRKMTFDQGIEVELDADVAAKIEAARAAVGDQLRRVRTAIASMPTGQRRHAWDAYRLLIRARTDANNAQGLAAAIRSGDAELAAAVRMVIDEINPVRLRQDRDREASPPSTRPH
jgi:hypothetical protein